MNAIQYEERNETPRRLFSEKVYSVKDFQNQAERLTHISSNQIDTAAEHPLLHRPEEISIDIANGKRQHKECFKITINMIKEVITNFLLKVAGLGWNLSNIFTKWDAHMLSTYLVGI